MPGRPSHSKKVANPSLAAAGDRVSFAAMVSNSKTTTASVSLTAVVPTGTTVASSELSLFATCDGASVTTCAAGQTLAFNPFNVPAGGEVTVVYPALVNSGVTNGTKMSSTAIAIIGTTKLSGAASAKVNSGAAMHVHLTASALPAQVLAGGTLTYTLTYGNPGMVGVAANLSFPLPAGAKFLSASGGGGTGGGGVVSWSLGTLAAGSAARQTGVAGGEHGGGDALGGASHDGAGGHHGGEQRAVALRHLRRRSGLPPSLDASRALIELEGNARPQGTPKYLIFLDGHPG